MIKRILHILLLSFLLSPQVGKAQQDILISQYMFNPMFLNPAYAGSHEYWESTILYRNQWTGWEGAPESQLLSVAGPVLPSLLGFGANVIHDKIGINESLSANINFAYHLKLDYTGKHKLSFGLKAGLQSQRAMLKDLVYWDENDPIYTGNEILTQNTLLLGAGIYYYSKKAYAGISAPTLFASDLKEVPTGDPTRNSYLKNHFYLNAGMVFTLSKSIDFKPSILLKYVPNTPLQLDINAHFLINKIVWLGVSYRTQDALVFMVEVNIKHWIRLGYAYDLTLSDLSKYGNGSHEILLGIDFGKTIVKSSSPRYF